MLLIFFSLICLSVTAEERALSLKEIDRLIEKSDYNTALKELTQYMNDHPDDFDRAQKRVAKVMKARGIFNSNASSLVELIRDGDGDQIDKLEKITALEKSETNPTKTVSEFTGLARRTVTMGDVLISYNRIMHQGIRLIEQEKYAEAASKFEEGFLIKNEFSDIVFENAVNGDENAPEQEGKLVEYESDITVPVSEAVKKVKAIDAGGLFAQGIRSLVLECDNVCNEFVRNVNAKNYDGAEKSFEKVRNSFGKLAALRNSVVEEARKLDALDRLANERNPLLLGTSYITFYQRFILGDEANANTGVIGAIDAFWNTRVENMKKRVNDVVFDALEKFQTEIPVEKVFILADKIERQQKNLGLAENFSSIAVSVQKLYMLPENLDGSKVGEEYINYERSMDYVKSYLADLIETYGNAGKIVAEEKKHSENDLALLQRPEKINPEVLEEEIALVSSYGKIILDSKNFLAAAEEAKKDMAQSEKVSDSNSRADSKKSSDLFEESESLVGVRKKSTAGTAVSDEPVDLRAPIEYFISVNKQNAERSENRIQKLWGFAAQGYLKNGNISYAELEKKCTEADAYLAGSEDGNLVKKYPKEAKSTALSVITEAQNAKNTLVMQRQVLSGGEKYRKVEPDFADGTDKIDSLIGKFDSLGLRGREIVQKADSQVRLAERAYEEGNSQYDKALSAFKRNDFASANAAVDAASEKYAESLDYQFDDRIRLMREETLAELASKILAAENEKVIRDVFELKERATSYYYESDFDNAESTLIRAQTLWSSTNSEPDPEIEELLTSVKNVKSLEFGRVLLSSDPHYPELSNSLNMAKLSFERGLEYKKNGNEKEALETFNVSLTNIRNVQNVYPLNKEARLINLMIQRELDPDGFPKLFENQYKAAKMNAKLNERLADLHDLYEINPKYPGLSKEIYDLEEELGMHPKKEVAADVKKRAAERVAEARRLLKSAGDDETVLNRALVQVNQAIILDGTNKAAKNLKLEIQLKIGAQATAILSQSDEKMYSEIGRLFNQRKFVEANDLMTELWKSAAARKSKKVIDLRNRIARRL